MDARPIVFVLRTGSANDACVWGMTAAERLRRAFARAGLKDVHETSEVAETAGSVGDAGERRAIVIRGDCVLDESLVRALVEQPDTVLTAGDGGVVAAHVDRARIREVARSLVTDSPVPAAALSGLRTVTPAELAGAYNLALRKREAPLALSLSTVPAIEAERRTFGAAYKGVTDLVTKWVWPRPAFWVTRWAASRSITPNAVTAASFVLVAAALGLFAAGHFAAGLVAAWGMTFLDTVDGKLARVTLTSSKIGNVFDHGIDLLHPPFWYWAWWRGAAALGSPVWLEPAMWVVIVGYVAGRLLEGAFLALFKFEIHAWRPVDSLFRQITARRNPNLILLTLATVTGRPDIGLLAVAVWTVVSSVFHVVRIGQGIAARATGSAVTSWLDGPEAVSSPVARYAA